MQEVKICQSCAMPLVKDADFGTDKAGGKSSDYCSYCYKNGSFTQDMDMEAMIEHCTQFLDVFNKHAQIKLTREQAVEQMRQHFPRLKRWAK